MTTIKPRISIKLPAPMREKLDALRNDDESDSTVVIRLVNEHLTRENQIDTVPIYGSRPALRVESSTIDYLNHLRNPGDNTNDVIVRIIDERSVYRTIADDLVDEGKRVLANHDSIVLNLKLIIKELVEIDVCQRCEEESILGADVDELAVEMMNTTGDEEDEQ